MDRIDKETRAKRKKSPGDRRVGGRSSRVKSRWRGVRRSLGLHAPTLSNAATSVEFSSACPPSSIFESCPFVPRRLTSCPPVEIRFRSWNRPHRTKKEKGGRKEWPQRRERRDDTCSHRCDQQVNSSQPKIETNGEFLSNVFAYVM